MTKQEAIDRLRELQGGLEVWSAHKDGDDVLCELLLSLECEDVVAEYHKIQKWFS